MRCLVVRGDTCSLICIPAGSLYMLLLRCQPRCSPPWYLTPSSGSNNSVKLLLLQTPRRGRWTRCGATSTMCRACSSMRARCGCHYAALPPGASFLSLAVISAIVCLCGSRNHYGTWMLALPATATQRLAGDWDWHSHCSLLRHKMRCTHEVHIRPGGGCRRAYSTLPPQ